MNNSELVALRLELQDFRKFMTETKQAGSSVRKVGDESKRADDKAGRSRGFGLFRKNLNATNRAAKVGFGSIKRMAGAAAGLAAAYVSIGAAKNAVNTTVDLAKTTLGLHRNTGLSIDSASQWAAVAKSRNIDAKALNMTFGKMSVAQQAALHGDEKMQKQFKKLGITYGDLRKGSKDFNSLILKTADGFGELEGGPARVDAGMKLLGRGWQTVLPLFTQGSKTLREQMTLAKKYGATFGDSTADQLGNFVKQQREHQFAIMGLNVALGTFLIPYLTKGLKKTNEFVMEMRNGTGEGGKFKDLMIEVAHHVKAAVVPMAKAFERVMDFAKAHPGVVKVVAAMAAFQLAAIGTRKALGLLGVFHAATGLKRAGTAAWGLRNGIIAIRREGGVVKAVMNRLFRSAGASAGNTAADATAQGMSVHMGESLRHHRGRIKAPFLTLFRAIGAAAAIAMATVIVAELQNKLNELIGTSADPDPRSPTRNLTDPASSLKQDILDALGFGARGGHFRIGSTVVVGEEGPEVARIGASGTQIIPLAQQTISREKLVERFSDGGSGDTHLTIPVVIDGKEIARVTAKHVDKKRARR